MPDKQSTLCIWDTEVQRTGDNTVNLPARRPLSRMSTRQAARLLGCSEWTVQKLYRHRLLTGWKPGAAATRKDGRPSNARIVLDAESVLEYKQKVSQRGVY